jgi:hypothetical protein
MTHLEELTQAVVKAVQSANDPDHYIAHDGKIWLDDVLMAFHRKSKLVSPIVVDQYGGFWEQNYGGDELLAGDKKGWTLGAPLSEQPPECLAFLHSLLCSSHD